MLKVSELSYSIKSKDLLKHISFDLAQGETCCILGPNGAGKTTLIKCLNKLLQITHGKIELHGKEHDLYSNLEYASECSYVPQKLSSLPPFTTAEFIRQSDYAWNENTSLDLEAILKQCEIEKFRTQSLNTLSGGELQRSLLASALYQNTPLILLDEVTAGLDPAHHDSICELINHYKIKENKSFLWITHDINSALKYADKILILKNGERFHLGSPEDHRDGKILSEAFEKNFKVLKDDEENTYLI